MEYSNTLNVGMAPQKNLMAATTRLNLVKKQEIKLSSLSLMIL